MSSHEVIRLNYTKNPRGIEPYTMEEWHELNPWVCPCCKSAIDPHRTEYDIVGGKHLAYVVHLCKRCGWWNSFKYWENRSGSVIYAVHRNEPDLEDFNLAAKEAELRIVLQVVRRNYEDLRHIHWKVFEQATQQMLSEMGIPTVDVSGLRGVGFDLLSLMLDGSTLAIEIKHQNYRAVGLSVVDRLRGAMQRQGADRGLIVTSNHFSREALETMTTFTLGQSTRADGLIPVTGLDLAHFTQWLGLRDNRDLGEVFSVVSSFHLYDALGEQ